jgi:hypothetical protein
MGKKMWCAATVNVLLAVIIVFFLIALSSSVSGRPLHPFVVTVSAICAAIVAIGYQLLSASRTLWVSPGELIVGFGADGESKTWTAAYARGWPVVLVLQIITLTWLVVLWQERARSAPRSLADVLLPAVVTYLLYRGLRYWGRGERAGGLIVGGYFALVTLGVHGWRFLAGVQFFPRLRSVMPDAALSDLKLVPPVLAVLSFLLVALSRPSPHN